MRIEITDPLSPMRLPQEDIESIERATIDAVPPDGMARMGRWLLPLDRGTVGRAHSAVPVEHSTAAVDARAIEPIEGLYAQNGLNTVFRIPQQRLFVGFRAALMTRGYVLSKPTGVYTGTVERMAAAAAGAARADVQLLAEPDDAWRAVFLGEGFDPVDGDSRVQILARARHAVFACVRVDGQTVATGMGSYSRGWASVHGMRTLPAYAGQGFARQILGALAAEAARRGMTRTFLQVQVGNTRAISLYRRAGFYPAWEYAYWSRPAVTAATAADAPATP